MATWAVIPAYRAAASIERVVRRALDVVDRVVVVDDACPERTGDVLQRAVPDERVIVVRHAKNRGVGGAVKTGMREAIARGASFVVKLDADDQMDTGYVPHMLDVLVKQPDVALVKGNRFENAETLTTMPVLRLLGNSALSFLVKIASGYWTIVDPTNGFIALRSRTVRSLDLDRLAERYFFEIDLLCALGVRRAAVAELQMPAIYGGERSSLSIRRVLLEFPRRLIARTAKRFVVNYVLREISVGTLCALLGIPLLLVAVVFGGIEWYRSAASGVPRTTGTIVLALLLFMIGFQLALQALMYDVQNAPRTYKARVEEGDDAAEALVTVAVGSPQ